VAAGLAAGAALGLFATLRFGWLSAVIGLVLLASSARWRLPKWLGRFTPALLVGASVAGGWIGALIGGGVLASGWAAYRGRAPNRGPCASCPQRALKVCEGIAPIVRRERAVMRLGARIVGNPTHL
jgi:hypothetical protein